MDVLSDPTLSVKRNGSGAPTDPVGFPADHATWQLPGDGKANYTGPSKPASPKAPPSNANARTERAPEMAPEPLYRPPPHNLEAEQALLGAILINNEAHERVSGFLVPQHFYDPLHQQIFETVVELIASGKRVTPITLKAFFDSAEPIDASRTVPQYLGKLAANATTIINARDYGQTIHDLYIRRQAIIVAEDLRAVAFNSPVDFPPKDQLAEATARLDAIPRGADCNPPAIVSAASFAGEAVPARLWHVLGMIPSRTATLLYGDGGTGKSLVALQLAVSTALGRPWLGHDVRRGSVLYIGAEDDLEEMQRRLASIAADAGVDLARLDNLHIMCRAGGDAILATADVSNVLRPTPLWRTVERAVDRLAPAMVVYDTLADLFAGNENDRSQARQFVGMLRGLAIRSNSAALLLAHPSLSGMATGSGSSGSTAWSNSVRSRLYLDRVREGDIEPDTNARVLRTKKANYAATGQELCIRWQDGVFVTDADGAPTAAATAKEMQADLAFLELLVAYEAEGRYVSERTGANYAPHVFAKDDRGKRIGKRSLEAAMNRLFAAGRVRMVEYGPPSRSRKRIGGVQ